MITRLARTLLLALSLCLLAPAALAQVAGLKQDVDYALIADGQPYRPLDGKVEVAEVFAYGCHHCADMAPKLEAWKRSLPANVRLTYVPAVWRDNNPPWVQAFFAAEAAGATAVSHAPMFRALHVDRSLPMNATLTELAGFYGGLAGVNAKAFAAALRDTAALDAKAKAAYAFVQRSQIEGTPSLVINGRYRVLGDSHEALMANAARLVKALAPTRSGSSTSSRKPR